MAADTHPEGDQTARDSRTHAWEPQAYALLRKHWGHSQFRQGQHEALAAALSGKDSIVILATGVGKSVCYQLVPLITGKPAVVVSPLISLMIDQVAIHAHALDQSSN